MHLTTLPPYFIAFGLDVAVKATILLGLAALIIALCRRSSAAWRHSIWLTAMLGLLLLPVLNWALPSWRWPILPAGWGEGFVAIATVNPLVATPATYEPRQIVTLPSQLAMPPSSGASSFAGEPGMTSHGPDIESTAEKPAAIQIREGAADIEPHASIASQWRLTIVVVWAIGAVLFALAIVRGWWRTAILSWHSQVLDDPQLRTALEEQQRRMSLRRKVRLREHPQPVVPMTWGVLRPVILLPMRARQWTQATQRTVLTHELAHIQRGDVVAQLIGRIACALHWYHPLAWYALRRLRQEREQACDDAVVRAGGKASDYAEQLIEVARLCVAPGGLSMAIAMAEGNSLERRLKSLFDLSHGHGPVRKIVVAAMFAMNTLIVGTLSAIDPIPQSTEATEPAESQPLAGEFVETTPGPQPSPREEAFAALVRGGKISTDSLNAMITLVSNEGATDPEFIERVVAELIRSCEAGQSNRAVLAILRDMFAIHGALRWQLDLAARRPHSVSEQGSLPDLSRITDEFQRKTLQRVISQARKATRRDIDDFVLVIRNAHHQDTKAFLLEVLNNSESNGDPVDPYAAQPAQQPDRLPTRKPGHWPDNLGGSWPDAKFHAAVGLAELGAVEGIDWLLAKAAPNDFGTDGSLFGAWQHVRETRGSLRENCRYALAELFGVDSNADHRRLTEIWQAGLGEFLPNPVSLGKAVAQTEKPKPLQFPLPARENESSQNSLEAPRESAVRVESAAPVPLDKVVWWGERVEGLEPGLWLTKTQDPRNLRIPMESVVNYRVVLRNTTDKESEFLVRLLPFDGLDVPYLIPSSQLDPKGTIAPPQPEQEFRARGAASVLQGIHAAYIITLAAGESVQLPGEYGLYVGKAPDERYPQIANFVPGTHWIVQPLLVHPFSDKERTGLNRHLGEIKATKFDRNGRSRQEPVLLVQPPVDSGQFVYAKYHLEVGTLDAAADRHAELAKWGAVEEGMQCGIRMINPQPRYKIGDTLEAEVLWRNTNPAVVSTSKPRSLDLYPMIEDTAGKHQNIDFGSRYLLLPISHDFQPGEVRSLGVTRVKLVAQGTPGPKDNKEPGHITLEPGTYLFTASSGVGNINPRSGKVPFTVIAGDEVPPANNAAAVPGNESSSTELPSLLLTGEDACRTAAAQLAGKAWGTVSLMDATFDGELVESLRHATSIRALRLYGNSLSGQIPRLQHVTGLTELELGGPPLKATDFQAIAELRSLTALSLPQETIIHVTAARELAKLINLRSLRLYLVGIDDAVRS